MISVCPILHQSGTLADWRSRLDAMLESAHAPAFVPVAIRCHLFPSSSAVVRLARPSRTGARRSQRRTFPQPASSRFLLPDAGFEPAGRARPGPASVPVFIRYRRFGPARPSWGSAIPMPSHPTGFEPVLPGRRRFPTGGARAGELGLGDPGAVARQPASSRFCLPDAGFQPAGRWPCKLPGRSIGRVRTPRAGWAAGMRRLRAPACPIPPPIVRCGFRLCAFPAIIRA